MRLQIVYGAYGFFPSYNEEPVEVANAEELAEVFRETSRAFNHYREPWGLKVHSPETGVTTYVWSTSEDAETVNHRAAWQALSASDEDKE